MKVVGLMMAGGQWREAGAWRKENGGSWRGRGAGPNAVASCGPPRLLARAT